MLQEKEAFEDRREAFISLLVASCSTALQLSPSVECLNEVITAKLND